MTDIIKIQTWDCLLHDNNSIYHARHEQDLFSDLTYPDNEENNQNHYWYPMVYIKRFFYFCHNEVFDPLHIKYMDNVYRLHPGHNRLQGMTLLTDSYDPLRCIVYSEPNKKLLPIKGLEVLNKIEFIDFPKESWKHHIITDLNIIKRYSKKVDSHGVSADELWAEYTQDLYRIFFEDRHVLLYPNEGSFDFNKRIDVNIEDFSGFREAIKYVFNCIKND